MFKTTHESIPEQLSKTTEDAHKSMKSLIKCANQTNSTLHQVIPKDKHISYENPEIIQANYIHRSTGVNLIIKGGFSNKLNTFIPVIHSKHSSSNSNSKLHSNFANIILSSKYAKFLPIHDRGPIPKGW
jgi:hypothetical protein